MDDVVAVELTDRVLHLRMTDADGPNLSPTLDPLELNAARSAVHAGAWTQLHQVHGNNVVFVDAPGSGDREVGDALVTNAVGAVLAVQTADCVPIALWSTDGAFGLAHAGWKGAAAGVIGEAADAVRSMSDSTNGQAPLDALVGYCICAACYEFGADDLAGLVEQFGADVATTTRTGSQALDMRGLVVAALRGAGVGSVTHLDRCTSCSPGLWSHRARSDPERQALVGWMTESLEPNAS